MILEYVGADWKEDSYSCGPAPNYDKSCWFDIKFKKGFDFPNLPYLIDGKYRFLLWVIFGLMTFDFDSIERIPL